MALFNKMGGIEYNTDIPKNTQEINNYISNPKKLDTRELKEEIIKSLEDDKITPDEAKKLQELMKDITNINSKSRKEWIKLSSNIRKEFQRKIGTDADGKIGPKTLEKLNDLASQNIEIKLESLNDYQKEKIVTLNNEVLLTQSNTRNDLKNINPDLLTSEYSPYTSFDFGESSKSKDGFNLTYVRFGVTNDNNYFLKEDGDIAGDDKGKTGGAEIEVGASYNNQNYKLNVDGNLYINDSGVTLNERGGKTFINGSGDDAIDILNVNVKKEFSKNKNERGDNYSIWAGGGMQGRGDFGGRTTQNFIHEKTNSYQNISTYDKNNFGVSPTLNFEAEGTKYFVGDKQRGLYVKGSADINYAISKKGVSEAEVKGGIGGKYNGLKLELGGGIDSTWGGGNSRDARYQNGTNYFAYGKASYEISKNLELGAEAKMDLSNKGTQYGTNKNNNDQVGIWVRYNF